jgi:hypothetical protein
MPEKTNPEHPNPHLHNPETGTRHGVPKGVTQEESTGLPDSGRHATESGPLHAEETEE